MHPGIQPLDSLLLSQDLCLHSALSPALFETEPLVELLAQHLFYLVLSQNVLDLVSLTLLLGKGLPGQHDVFLLFESTVVDELLDHLVFLLVLGQPIEVLSENAILLSEDGLASEIDDIAVEHEATSPAGEHERLTQR